MAEISADPGSNGGTSTSTRVQITLKVFYDPADHSIALVIDHPRLTDENGVRPGFRVTFNGNPKSADYTPANLNRLARLLRDNGQPAPADVPVKKRQLALRSKIIADLTAESIRAAGRSADPTRSAGRPPGLRRGRSRRRRAQGRHVLLADGDAAARPRSRPGRRSLADP